MLIPDHEICEAVELCRIGIDPWDPDLVQPASVDLRLGERFIGRQYAPGFDTSVAGRFTVTTLGRWSNVEHTGPLDLTPGQFVLAHTLETVTLPGDVAGRFEGKSSLGRIGLLTHVTAGFIDPGFSGQITLELYNLSQENISLVPSQPIGQLCLQRLTSPAARPYGSPGLGSHYQGQTGPVPSRLREPA